MRIQIKRNAYTSKQVTGKLTVFDSNNKEVYQCFTLELPDLNNQPKKSCIPQGCYKVKKRTSPKYGPHFHITNVVNRDLILLHVGNYFTEILGCVLIGTGLADLNGDGQIDVTNSKKAMVKLLELMPAEFDLQILK